MRRVREVRLDISLTNVDSIVETRLVIDRTTNAGAVRVFVIEEEICRSIHNNERRIVERVTSSTFHARLEIRRTARSITSHVT